MDPVITILRIGVVERPIGSYGLLLAAAMVVACLIAVRAAVRAGMDAGATIAALGFAIAGAFVGGLLMFVCVEWARTGSLSQALSRPGLVFFGAPLLGFPVLALACRALRLPVGRLLDVAVPALPAGHALGRIGCFLGGCCYGAPWDGPWAVRYTHELAPAAYPSVMRHPTPLYEAAALLVLALAFALRPPGAVGDGRRMGLYVVAYGCVRIVVEMVRGDRIRGLWIDGALSTSQLISLVLVLAVGGLLLWTRSRAVGGPAVRQGAAGR